MSGGAVFAFTRSGTATADASMTMSSGSADESGVVAVVGAGDAAASGTPMLGNSWPAELISSNIVQVQPQREGVLVDWRVHVGDTVSAGQVLGHISAPPATPDIIKMLADQTQAVAEADANVKAADAYTSKEKARYAQLGGAIDSSTTADVAFPALASIRAQVAVKQSALRSVIERALAEQVALMTNATDWRNVRYGSLNRSYGSINQNVQNQYETALIALSGALQKSTGVPLQEAQDYFALAIRVANSTVDDGTLGTLKATVASDQKDVLDALSDYRDAQMSLADKETEYRLMIQSQSAALEKDQTTAQSSAVAARAAYRTVSQQVNGGSAIIAPRAGTISSISKNVGDLVSPDMPLAIIVGYGQGGLTVRMHIPSTSMKPNVGDTLSVVRPGFPNDMHQAKLIGIGSALDDTGSYMADAVLADAVNWPVSGAVRVLAPKEDGITVRSSAVWWSEGGGPMVWAVSPGGRIFGKKITIGRTIGAVTEVYSGLANGDKYLIKATSDIQEDMLLDDLIKTLAPTQTPSAKSSGDAMGGMVM